MKLLVGLGNPGKEYEHTRHNVGFSCLDVLHKFFVASPWKLEKKFNALFAQADFSSEKLFLAKPQTFMNASGESVAGLFHFYKMKPEDLWLFYDDVDLPLGRIRLRPEGTAGTHNGMKSVIAALGFKNFSRLRIGIESRGITAPKAQDTSSFVLHPFLKTEEKTVQKTLEMASRILLDYLKKQVTAATFSL